MSQTATRLTAVPDESGRGGSCGVVRGELGRLARKMQKVAVVVASCTHQRALRRVGSSSIAEHRVTATLDDAPAYATTTGTRVHVPMATPRDLNATSTHLFAPGVTARWSSRCPRSCSPVRENDPVHPTSTYARTKWEAEELLGQVAEASGTLQSVALRIFNVFGDEFADSLVTRLVRSTPAAPVVLSGFDTFVRDYVHVDDVVSALVLSLRAPLRAPHSTFNIGSGVPMSNRDLLEHLSGLRPLSYVVGEERVSYSSANIELARRILGFEPTHAMRP